MHIVPRGVRRLINYTLIIIRIIRLIIIYSARTIIVSRKKSAKKNEREKERKLE